MDQVNDFASIINGTDLNQAANLNAKRNSTTLRTNLALLLLMFQLQVLRTLNWFKHSLTCANLITFYQIAFRINL